jgi:glycosyltransferase involved in cell wall biosynthesis
VGKHLLITNIFPPHIGGPAVFIDRLAHALVTDGHDVTVLCSSDAISAQVDSQRPFTVRRVDMTNRYRYEVEVRLRLARELATHDRILVNGLETYLTPIARKMRRRFLLKVVGDSVWEWGRNSGVVTEGFDEFQRSPVVDPRLRAISADRAACLALASRIITPSNYLRRVVAGWGVPEERISVIHNGAPTASTQPRPLRDPTGPLHAVFCGRLTNWKGVETAILAVQQSERVVLTVAGDGPELPMLRQLASQAGVDERVTFTGRIGRDAVERVMAQGDVLVLASAYEGLSHTLLEGCAAGLVPIVSSIGGNVEVVHDGVDGLVVPYGNVLSLRRAFEHLTDRSERVRLAQGAARIAERFPFETTVRSFADLLEGKAA